jgi:hypothetical protein
VAVSDAASFAERLRLVLDSGQYNKNCTRQATLRAPSGELQPADERLLALLEVKAAPLPARGHADALAVALKHKGGGAGPRLLLLPDAAAALLRLPRVLSTADRRRGGVKRGKVPWGDAARLATEFVPETRCPSCTTWRSTVGLALVPPSVDGQVGINVVAADAGHAAHPDEAASHPRAVPHGRLSIRLAAYETWMFFEAPAGHRRLVRWDVRIPAFGFYAFAGLALPNPRLTRSRSSTTWPSTRPA